MPSQTQSRKVYIPMQLQNVYNRRNKSFPSFFTKTTLSLSLSHTRERHKKTVPLCFLNLNHTSVPLLDARQQERSAVFLFLSTQYLTQIFFHRGSRRDPGLTHIFFSCVRGKHTFLFGVHREKDYQNTLFFSFRRAQRERLSKHTLFSFRSAQRERLSRRFL